MQEVLTKKFWQSVKKTFDQARADPPPQDPSALPPAEAGSEAPIPSEPAAPAEPAPSPSASTEPDMTS